MICSSVNLDFFMSDFSRENGLYFPSRGTETGEQVTVPLGVGGLQIEIALLPRVNVW